MSVGAPVKDEKYLKKENLRNKFIRRKQRWREGAFTGDTCLVGFISEWAGGMEK